MAIAIQAGSIDTFAGALSSTTPFGTDLSIAVASGDDRILVVLISNAVGSGGGMPATLTVTYDGVSLTQLSATGAGPSAGSGIYYMLAPPVGTATLACNVSSWYGQNLAISAAVFTGVNQATPFGTPDLIVTSSKTSPATSTLAAGVDDATLSVATVNASPTDLAPGAGQTSFGTLANIGNRGCQHNYKIGASSSVEHTWTSGTEQIAMISVVVNAAVPAPILSGEAVLSDITASGGMATAGNSELSGEVVLSGITADGGMGLAPGVITTPALKNNTGTILASVSGIVANVYHPTTGALVVRKTGLTSNGSGIVTISDVLLSAGTTYAYELDLSASSQGRRLPTGVAA